jgi:NTP pyrophosphatase (non-canonical NTP hydrolase)
MSDIKKLTEQIKKFRDRRDWKQFHNPKDSAIALLSEATEVLDLFKWQNSKEIEVFVKEKRREIGNELSDVLYWVLLMAYDLKIDLPKSFDEKMKENDKKYPVGKVKGKHTKYNKL